MLIVIAEEEVNNDVMADDTKKEDVLVKTEGETVGQPVTSEAANVVEANPAAGDANAPSTEQPTTTPTSAWTPANQKPRPQPQKQTYSNPPYASTSRKATLKTSYPIPPPKSVDLPLVQFHTAP